ncbi:ribosome biogenesis GTP-binding protein YsxC [Lentibacillus halophilus]|uniref:Probable GTP-binding protein EngB n=1 Tax=Lentibacillus halophilus TaxID=295065 RepID=A0ABN0ZBU3_9BACI
MKVTEAELVISAVGQDQYPNDDLPEIALAGRSNVGKSSFINQLIQRKSLARTSSKPGKTQTINFYKINNMFYFVDVPGYGYAQVSKTEREKWGVMMEEYFDTRQSLKACAMITDLRHPPTKDDVQMYAFLKHYELPVVVIGTKMDKIAKGKRASHLQQTIRTLQVGTDDTVIPFSAETGEGKKEAWRMLSQYMNH